MTETNQQVLSDLLHKLEDEEATSATPPASTPPQHTDEIIELGDDFDFDGFQVVRREFFAHMFEPAVSFKEDMKLGKTPCVIAVPANLAATSSQDSFSYWANCKGIAKFYFGDPMDLTEGITRYSFKPAAEGSTEVTTVIAKDGAGQVQGGSSKGKVPIWQKSNLTVEEAAAYFGIGTQKIRALTDNPRCDFVLFVGSKRLIKREKFEKYLHTLYSI